MKTRSLIFFLIAFYFSSNSQTIIYGNISNPKSKVVKLTYWDGETKTIEAKLDKKNSFRINSDIKAPQGFDFEHGNESTKIFLFPKDTLHLTLDTKKFDESIIYSGRGAIVNNFLAKQYLHFENSIGSQDFMQKYYSKIAFCDAKTFCNFADSIEHIRLNYLKQYKQKLPTAFYDYQYAEIVFDYAKNKADYPNLHYFLQGIKDSTVKVEPEYYHFYNGLKITNENYLTSYKFVLYLEYYISYKTRQKLNRDSVSFWDKAQYAKEILSGKIKEKTISEIILESFDYATPDMVNQMYQLSHSDIHDEKLLQSIENKYKLITTLMPGKSAPLFSLKTKEGTLINLSDFKGKVVYLDFWASWCAPCMMEMPAAKKLQDTFANKDVVFIYVSIDDDEHAWTKAIDDKKLKGIHLRAKGFEHTVTKMYGVNGIPAYYLIGKDGKIINNNPSRPSNPKIYIEIDKALKSN